MYPNHPTGWYSSTPTSRQEGIVPTNLTTRQKGIVPTHPNHPAVWYSSYPHHPAEGYSSHPPNNPTEEYSLSPIQPPGCMGERRSIENIKFSLFVIAEPPPLRCYVVSLKPRVTLSSTTPSPWSWSFNSWLCTDTSFDPYTTTTRPAGRALSGRALSGRALSLCVSNCGPSVVERVYIRSIWHEGEAVSWKHPIMCHY